MEYMAVGFVNRAAGAEEPAAEQLGREVAGRGWILYPAKTSADDYDFFLARPNGSQVTNLSPTPDFNEFGGRFSPDSRQMLYWRTPKDEPHA